MGGGAGGYGFVMYCTPSLNWNGMVEGFVAVDSVQCCGILQKSSNLITL